MSSSTAVTARTHRWIPVFASIAIQLCLGTAYIWSVFQTGVATKLFGGDNAAAGLTFSLLLGFLSLGSVLGGKIQQKFSMKAVLFGGGIILGSGFLLASMVGPSAPWMLWISYGVLGGIGMGTVYGTTISCAQRWFPDKRGLITGLIVSALGFGGVLFTPIAESMIKKLGGGAVGVGELKTFGVLGIIFIVVCFIGALLIKEPPAGYLPQGYKPVKTKETAHADYSPIQMLKTPQFYAVFFTFMVACMGGLMIIGFAKPIALAKGIDKSVAAVGVMIIAIFNSFGRLFWGYISDKIGRKNTLLILLVITAATVLFVNAAAGYMIFVLVAVVGFSYGGYLGVFPALTADFWGPKHMSTNYGFVLIGFGAGAIISSYIAGYYKNLAAKDISLMFPAFVIAAGAALLGAVIMYFVKAPKAPEAVSLKEKQAVQAAAE